MPDAFLGLGIRRDKSSIFSGVWGATRLAWVFVNTSAIPTGLATLANSAGASSFLIVGGLYSVTALQKNKTEGDSVY